MIAVIFEVEPAEGRFDEYLGHAARLKANLEQLIAHHETRAQELGK